MSRLRVIAKRTAVGLGIVYLAASGAAAQETPSPPQLFYAVGPAEVPEQASLPENAMMNLSVNWKYHRFLKPWKI